MAWEQSKIIMKKIPITLNYDQSKEIGEAVINVEDEKVKKILDSGEYTFRAGFIIHEKVGNTITKAELREISLIPLPEKLGYKKENYDNRQGKGSERATEQTKES